jgi:outer membrane protein TolC
MLGGPQVGLAQPASILSGPQRGLPAAPIHEQVPGLGEAQIGFLEALRASRGRAESQASERQFRDAVRDAVKRHPEVQGAVAAQFGARGFTEEAKASLRPQVSGQTEGGWRSFDANRLFGVPERRYNSAGWGLVEARRSELVLRAVQAAIEFETARLQSALARENERARLAIAQYVRDRYELGGGSLSDVLRAQARVADAQAGSVAALTRVESAAAAYREIFGVEPAEGSGPMRTVEVPDVGSTGQMAAGFATVRAASAAREAAQSELKSVAARALPQLNLEGTFTRRDQVGDGWPANDRAALLNFRYEFYTGGAAQARESQALARLDQADQDYASAVLSFERFASQVLAEARSSEQLVRARVEAAELAASSLRAVREQFAFRRGTLLDLLNAQEVLQAAGRELIDAYAQQVFGSYRVLYVASRLDTKFGLTD